MNAPPELETLRDWLRFAVSRFTQADLSFGHGFDNAFDEAIYLLLHTLHLPLDRTEPFLDAKLTHAERSDLAALLTRRIDERVPRGRSRSRRRPAGRASSRSSPRPIRAARA